MSVALQCLQSIILHILSSFYSYLLQEGLSITNDSIMETKVYNTNVRLVRAVSFQVEASTDTWIMIQKRTRYPP